MNNEKNIKYNTPNGIIYQLDIFKGKRALIGDYLLSSYFNTKMVLESLGIDVEIAYSIEEVERRISSGEKYDVIFSNNIYKSGTGLDLLKRLRNINGFNTPVILHSATKNLKEHALNMGFSGFLAKPIMQKEVIEILKDIF